MEDPAEERQNEAQQQVQGEAVAAGYAAMMAVVSGDSDGGDLSDEDEILLSPQSHPHYKATQDNSGIHESEETKNSQSEENLYDEHLDDDDEAYVYMNLRGGKRGHDSNSNNSKDKKVASPSGKQDGAKTVSTTPPPPGVTKARNSDAVLSCPCCFNLVCMDCQRHERFHNQFRAMFVMGIEVDWEHRLVYDDKAHGLVRYEPQPNSTAAGSPASQIVAPDQHHPDAIVPIEGETIYYVVSCASCHTMVAALDMNDEVYHFYDCLAST